MTMKNEWMWMKLKWNKLVVFFFSFFFSLWNLLPKEKEEKKEKKEKEKEKNKKKKLVSKQIFFSSIHYIQRL